MVSLEEELGRCRREIERLAEENALLRRSSESFSALAERLQDLLKREGRTRHGDESVLSS
jgi:hypothetical protein